jgi:DNA-binding YbaB/EbfC family protein
MKDLTELMKQAGAMQARLQEAQEKIAALEIEGQAGGGMVKIILNGKGYCKGVSIERALMNAEESEVLEDLVAAAINDAKSKLEIEAAQQMRALTAGIPMPPGVKLPF